MLASVLLCVSNAVTFESARKEYALGKTMTSSVKTGYKKCFWKLFDLHIVVAIIAFLVVNVNAESYVYRVANGLGEGRKALPAPTFEESKREDPSK